MHARARASVDSTRVNDVVRRVDLHPQLLGTKSGFSVKISYVLVHHGPPKRILHVKNNNKNKQELGPIVHFVLLLLYHNDE